VQASRVLDHPRRQVDPGHVDAALGEVRRHRAGAAADVEDRPDVADRVGEHVQGRPHPRLAADVAQLGLRDRLDVGVGDPVVRVAHHVEILGTPDRRTSHDATVATTPDSGRRPARSPPHVVRSW
jgi:hypothetical protein